LHTAASRPAATRPAAGREALEAAAATLREPAWGGGWRLNGPPRIRLVAVEDPADERTVSPAPVATDEALATDEARTSPQSVGMELASVVAGDGTVYVDVAGRSVGFRLAPPPDVDRSARLASAHHGGGAAELRAPMPGSIVTVHRRAGESVALGDPIVTLEAMKMEHVVAAPAPGLLAEVEVRPGDQVTRGQRLATIEPPR